MMRKSSRSISLALIGSALLLGGCRPSVEESEWTDEKDVAQTDNGNDWGPDDEVAATGENATLDGVATGNAQYNHGGGGMGRVASGIGGAMIGSQIGRSLGRGMSSPSYGGGVGGNGGMAAGPSARGGFGSSAGGFGASGGGSASS